MISGNISASGTASVGAAVVVPVVSKTTEAFVGQNARVTGLGNSTGLPVKTGTFTISLTDTRFGPNAVSAGKITLPYAHGLSTGQQVVYSSGGGNAIGGLVDGRIYTVTVVSDTEIQLMQTNEIQLTEPADASQQYLEHSGAKFYFNSVADVSPGDDSIALGSAQTGLKKGDVVTYHAAGGQVVGGLVDGGTYVVNPLRGNAFQLASSVSAFTPVTVSLSGAGATGTGHRVFATNSASSPGVQATSFDPKQSGVIVGNDITLPYQLKNQDGHAPSAPTHDGDGYHADAVVYRTGGGRAIGNLTDGKTYYVITQGLPAGTIRLAATAEDAFNGTAIALTVDMSETGYGIDQSILFVGQNPSPNGAEMCGIRTVSADESTLKGVFVTATNRDDFLTIGMSGGGSGTVAVNVGGVVNVIHDETRAHIDDGARINADNTDADPGQCVQVAAGSEYRDLSISGALSGAGTVAVAPAVDVRVGTFNTYAWIGTNTLVNASGDIVVKATGREQVLSISVGIAGAGTAAVGGSVIVSVLDCDTRAFLGGNAQADTSGSAGDHVTATAGGNVLVLARDDTKASGITGAVGGGTVGVGASVGVLSISKDTRAHIGDYAVVDALGLGDPLTADVYAGTITDDLTFLQISAATPFKGVAVQAGSSEDIFGIAIAGGGGVVGVAGGINISIVHSDTMAIIGRNAAVNTLAGAGDEQSVNVTAVNSAKAFTVGGGLGVGVVGVGFGLDIGILDNDTGAKIGQYSVVNAKDSVAVNALSVKKVETLALRRRRRVRRRDGFAHRVEHRRRSKLLLHRRYRRH